jgi:hypothetical protein
MVMAESKKFIEISQEMKKPFIFRKAPDENVHERTAARVTNYFHDQEGI